jgi:hypothetical protein
MKIRLPPLQIGKTYKASDLTQMLSEDELERASIGFPSDIQQWPNTDILRYRPDEEIVFDYVVMPIGVLRPQIVDLRRLFRTKEDDWCRVRRIKELLERGEVAWPVFIQKNDPEKRITEGMHRSVAMLQLSIGQLPVLLSKYQDW